MLNFRRKLLLRPQIAQFLILLTLILAAQFARAEEICWSGILTNNISEPIPYCEPVTFTYKIYNICTSASKFNVEIRFESSEYSIFNMDELPGATYVPGVTDVLIWETPEIAVNQLFEFDLKLILTSSEDQTFYVNYRVKREDEVNFYKFPADNTAVRLKYVDGPATASDLIQDYWDNSVLTILPVEDPENIGILLACETTSPQELFVSGGIDFDLGTEAEPVEYCIYNPNSLSILRMGEGSYLRVKAYTTLTLTDMDIRSCNEMWKGFIVEKNARLNLRNCTISGA